MYRYTRTADEASPTRLPDCEVWYHQHGKRERCWLNGDGTCITDEEGDCLGTGWYFAFLDGGLDCFSSEPSGPYPTEAAALAAAREDAGVCPHGCGDDEPCAECDGEGR